MGLVDYSALNDPALPGYPASGLEGPWKGREWVKAGRRGPQEKDAGHHGRRCTATEKPPQVLSPTVRAHKEGWDFPAPY